jgi:hypothetical protein
MNPRLPRTTRLAPLLLGAVSILCSGAPTTATASTGLSYHFPAPPIASAGSLGPAQSITFILRVQNNGVLDPGGPVYLSYLNNGHVAGDMTSLPAAQCGGATQMPADGTSVFCTADSSAKLSLTYTTPAQPPAQGETNWVASATATGGVPRGLDHYVYSTIYRFTSSPIAASGSLAAGATVPVILTAKDGLNHGAANSTVFVSLKKATGGGSAAVGTVQLTSVPSPFLVDSTGTLAMSYTAPSPLPSSGQDSIVVQDSKIAREKNSDSYAFAASTPVVSVGDVTVVEGDDHPTIPAEFTVTISPVQASPVTVQYRTLCGIGDKGCGEDFVQINAPTNFTIAANAASATVNVPQFSYIGAHSGETFNEGWFVEVLNPSVGVVGRSMGTGVLLPDVEGSSTALPYLYAGSAAVVPVNDPGGVPLYFTITLGGALATPVTFNYSTSNGTAIAGTDYVAVSGTATVPAGQTSAVIQVTVLPNSPPATPRTFNFAISNASGGATISRATGSGTILNA